MSDGAGGDDATADTLYERGLKIRREVLGDEYVQRALDGADDFNRTFHQFVTEYCWGAGWGRDGLPRKVHSMLNIAMLSVLNRPQEFKTHLRAAIGNGVSLDEVREILIHVSIYAGVPAGVDAFRVATAMFAEGGSSAAEAADATER